MLYLDTSIVVTLFTFEPATAATKDWVDRQDADDFAISEWVATEFFSALGTKVRIKAISPEAAAGAEMRFARYRDQFSIVDFHNRYFLDAGRYLMSRMTTLRANDALHLAIAAGSSATLCTRDRRFADAAAAIGHPVELI